MNLQFKTALEQVVDPLSIGCDSPFIDSSNPPIRTVLNNKQDIVKKLNTCNNSYLLGAFYFMMYLDPCERISFFDSCLEAHDMQPFIGHDFLGLHEAIDNYEDYDYSQFLKGICFAHEALPALT